MNNSELSELKIIYTKKYGTYYRPVLKNSSYLYVSLIIRNSPCAIRAFL